MNRVQKKFIERNAFTKKSYLNKKIGLIIPTTTRGLDIKTVHDLPLMKYFWKSFLKWCNYKNYYHFHIGYDYDDQHFIEVLEDLNFILKSMIPAKHSSRFLIKFHKFDEIDKGGPEKGDLSTMWSILADKAMDSGCEYLFQIGDDVEILNGKDWEDIFMRKLESMNNIGVVGPFDKNNSKLMTQSFVHCTHLSLFRRYFPKELKNWYIDDWMMEIYRGKPCRQVIVKNCGGKERYNVEEMEKVKDDIVKRDNKYIEGTRGCKEIIYVHCNRRLSTIIQSCLVICSTYELKKSIKYIGEIDSKTLKLIIDSNHKPEVYSNINGNIIKKTSNNIVWKTHDGIEVVKNLNNYSGESCDDNIYLIQQFFIPANYERYNEVKECIQRNVSNKYFEKIYLLNERIYNAQEMGLESIPPHVVQINIGKRLNFSDAFQFGEKLTGFICLSNSDIFFDDSISECRNLGLEKHKCIEILCRYEYRGQKNLKTCIMNPNMIGSQDTWIVHTNSISPGKKADFCLGRPGCDIAINDIFRRNGTLLLNDNDKIKTYHVHKDERRVYYRKYKRVDGPYTMIFASPWLGNCTKVFLDYNMFWQYPVITEKTFFTQNWNDKNYVDIPWASILDKKIEIPDMDKFITEVKNSIPGKNRYTCCQHIRFRDLIPIFKKIGIQIVYSPHKIIGEDTINDVKIIPCPLYPEAVENDRDNFFRGVDFVKKKRKYLYSFRGSYKDFYISNIRDKILNMKHKDDTAVEKIETWHFNRIVYSRSQNRGYEYDSDETHDKNSLIFKNLLLDSTFTLCPSGSGPNSIRLWEALGTGSIPVLLADTLELPEHNLWEKAIVRIQEKNIDNLDKILRRYTEEERMEMVKNCLIIYNNFKDNYAYM